MLCSLANTVGDREIAEIRGLESRLATTLLAYSCQEARPAAMSPEQLAQIKDLEDKLGVALVAIEA